MGLNAESIHIPGKTGSRRVSVLITGAAGGLGILLTRALAPHYALELLDCRDLRHSSAFPFHKIDLRLNDALRDGLTSVDTVIHLAGIPNNDADWEALLESNVMAVENLLKAAVDQGCRRVILASSVQVMDGYSRETDILPEMPVRPINQYGTSKACAEAVAARFGRRSALSVICLRLGWVLARTDWRLTPAAPHLDRVLTREDFIRAVRAAVDAPADVHFGIFHVLSDNRRKRLNIDLTKKILHFEPRDDAFRLARWNFPGKCVEAGIRAKRLMKRILGGEPAGETAREGRP